MKKSICFISRYAHYVLMHNTGEKIGGAEFQQVVIAKALRDRGWHVEFITEKFSDREPIVADGLEIIGGLDYSLGSRLTRRFFHLPVQLWRLMRNSKAEIFYQRNPGLLSFFIGLFSRIKGKRFVLAGAHDTNFDINNQLNINNFIDKIEIKYGIDLASLVILQNMQQKYLLRKNYKKDGKIFYNIYNPPSTSNQPSPQNIPNRKKRIIWIARLAKEKRPELCIDLARILKEYEIIVIGAREPSVARQPAIDLAEAAKSIPNLTFLGHLPLEDVEVELNSSQALINTAISEGFPNTFLQAWSRGLPVFSFIDPDKLISRHSLGKHVNSIEEMAEAINNTLNDHTSYEHLSVRIKKYFNQHFSVHSRIRDLETMLLG